MRTRELTEIVGRRDATAIGLALEENWNDWAVSNALKRPPQHVQNAFDELKTPWLE